MNIAVLIASHNRRETTLDCLARLFDVFDSVTECVAKVFLVDDGSTDGTADSVLSTFPDVCLIEEDGNLFWAKGMRKAWEVAIAERNDWDGFLWLNDDTALCRGAIEKLMAANDGHRIVVGNLGNSKDEVVYGLREGGLFTGNCVFVPRKVYERLGMICGDYSHAWADSDYAMQAKRAGIEIISAGIVGRAEGHPNRPRLKGKSLLERLALLRNPKGWNLHDLWIYRRRNWGYCAAIGSCIHLVLHVIKGER